MLKSERKLLFFIMLNITLLCIGHAYSFFPLVALSLAIFLMLLVLSKQKYFFPVALFHIPFVLLLRFNAESFSFFSLGVIFYFLWEVCIRTGGMRRLPGGLLIAILGICVYIITIGALRGSLPNLSMIMTLCLFAMVPLVGYHCREQADFKLSAYYFAFGVLISCVLSLVFQEHAGMKPFIEVAGTDVAEATRVCGFTGDGNRMGYQTLAAMAAIMVLQLKDRGRDLAKYTVMLVLLLICGVLTVSKMFLLEAAILILLWGFAFYRQKGMHGKKIGLLIGVTAVVLVVLGSGVLDAQIDTYLQRFGIVTDMSDFTTGRTDIWEMYIEHLSDRLDVLLVGNGWMSEYLYFFTQHRNVAPHNFLLEMLYRIGFFGGIFLLAWMISFYKRCVPDGFRIRNVSKIVQLIVVLGFFLPWFALPAMDFDEFFILPPLAMYAVAYSLEKKNS